jgi:hypothetical protein
MMTPGLVLGQVYNVRAYGAFGNGLTDDTAAFTAAFAAAGANVGVVYVPDGHYVISGPLASNAPLSLIGESANAILIRTNFTGVLVNLAGPGSYVHGLTINGNGLNIASIFAEVEISGTNSVIDTVQVVATLHIGIAVAGDHCEVRGCNVTGLGTAPVLQQGYGIWACADNTGIVVADNTVSGTGIDGIGISGIGFRVTGNNVSNCHCFTGEGGGQIVVYNDGGVTRDGLVESNVVGRGNAPVAGGLELNGTDISVIANVVSNQQYFGMVVDSGNGWNFSGNTVRNSGQAVPGSQYAWQCAALALPAGSTGFSVTGNRFVDDQTTPTQTCGVYIWPGASDQYLITGNMVIGNTLMAIADYGTGYNKLITNNLGA